MNATFMGIALSEREVAALAALDAFATPANGGRLATKMTRSGRPTSHAAAHQAGSGLARKGLASKAQQDVDLLVRYEITNAGRDWIDQYRRMGGRP